MASNVIRDMVGARSEKPLTINFIKQKAADYFSLSANDLSSKLRTKELAYARQIAMYLSENLPIFHYQKLEKILQQRPHNSHACL